MIGTPVALVRNPCCRRSALRACAAGALLALTACGTAKLEPKVENPGGDATGAATPAADWELTGHYKDSNHDTRYGISEVVWASYSPQYAGKSAVLDYDNATNTAILYSETFETYGRVVYTDPDDQGQIAYCWEIHSKATEEEARTAQPELPTDASNPAASGCGAFSWSLMVPHPGPYAAALHDLDLGPGSGFGANHVEDTVTGPPDSTVGPKRGSVDVVSLGHGGVITVSFAPDVVIKNGPGPDFVVFENAFIPDGGGVFAELARVSVSNDGETYHSFPCLLPPAAQHGAATIFPDSDPNARNYKDCAGWRPGKVWDATNPGPIDPSLTGGDPFDLAMIGLDEARFVRIEDLSIPADPTDPSGGSKSAGFDLDAVAVVEHPPSALVDDGAAE